MFKSFKKKLFSPFIILLASGLLLNLSFFFHNIFTEILAFFVIVPAFCAITKIEKNKRYLGGIIFFSSWLIPTTYWYYNFMPVWLAVLASVGYITLIANTFQLSNLVKNKSVILDYIIIIFSWEFLTIMRTSLPITNSWWIPNLAYTQWQNLPILQIAHFASIYGIELIILIVNSFIAYLLINHKKKISIIFVLSISTILFFGNIFFTKIINKDDVNNVVLIAVQSLSEKTFLSIPALEKLTENALAEIQNKNLKDIFILWPENHINEFEAIELKDFAIKNNIYLIYNGAIKTDVSSYNAVVMLDKNGNIILKNFKIHIAPGENTIPKNDENNNIIVNNIKITSAVCYDLHFMDLKKRAKNNNLLFAPINDSEFGNFMPYFHAEDVIFRAIENRISILTASTNGPTFYVNKYGSIESGPLKISENGFIILNK